MWLPTKLQCNLDFDPVWNRATVSARWSRVRHSMVDALGCLVGILAITEIEQTGTLDFFVKKLVIPIDTKLIVNLAFFKFVAAHQFKWRLNIRIIKTGIMYAFAAVFVGAGACSDMCEARSLSVGV